MVEMQWVSQKPNCCVNLFADCNLSHRSSTHSAGLGVRHLLVPCAPTTSGLSISRHLGRGSIVDTPGTDPLPKLTHSVKLTPSRRFSLSCRPLRLARWLSPGGVTKRIEWVGKRHQVITSIKSGARYKMPEGNSETGRGGIFP